MKIRDNETGQVFEYGTNKHHALFISEDGSCLMFKNLQNGDGSNGGGYSFVLDDGKTPKESKSKDALYGATYANIGGFENDDIEKILQEIGNSLTGITGKKREGMIECMDIIQKHLFCENHAETMRQLQDDGWIHCSDQMPEEQNSIFAKWKGTDKWSESMFEKISSDVNVTVEYEDGTRKTITTHTLDGKWKLPNRVIKQKVIAWRPMPEPCRKEGE